MQVFSNYFPIISYFAIYSFIQQSNCDSNGNITNTSGRVRNNSSGGQNSGYYIKQSTVKRNW